MAKNNPELEFSLDDFSPQAPSSEVATKEKPTTREQVPTKGSEFSLDDFSTGPQQSELQQLFPEVPKPALDLAIAPLVEATRGFYRTAGGMYGKLDAVTTMAGKSMGFKEPSTFSAASNLFKKWSDGMEQIANTLPETNLHPIDKQVWEAVGASPVIASEFGAISKTVGAGESALSQVGQFGLAEALNEYHQKPEWKSLPVGFGKGAAQGAAAMVAFDVGRRTIQLLYKGGRDAALAFARYWSGNQKTAEDFVNNPNAYNLKLRDRVKTNEEIKIENKFKKLEASQSIENEKFAFKEKVKRDKLIANEKLKNAESELKESRVFAEQQLKEKNAATIDEMSNQVSKSLEKSEQALQEKAVTIYDNALEQYNLAKKTAGERVDQAIDDVMAFDPVASVSAREVNNRVNNLIRKKAPFLKQPNKQKFISTSAGDPNELRVFNNIVDELRVRVKNDDLTIGFMQQLKKDLRNRAASVAKSNGELAVFYNDFADAVNPAQYADGFFKLNYSFPQVGKALNELKAANKSFDGLMQQYDRAMNLYFKKNALGNYVPDPGRVLNALDKNDIVALREMKIADSAVPDAIKILPQMRELSAQTNKFAIEQRAILKAAKRKVKQEEFALNQASKKSLDNIRNKKVALTREESEKAINMIRDFNAKKDAEFLEINKILDSKETFFKQQNALRDMRASGESGAAIAQVVLGGTALGLLRFKPMAGVGLGAAAAMLSPNFAAKNTRMMLNKMQETEMLLAPLLQNKLLQQLVATREQRR